MATDLHVGDTLDLGCRFGNQVRLKCPRCSLYLKPATAIECGRCGTLYASLTETIFTVEGMTNSDL